MKKIVFTALLAVLAVVGTLGAQRAYAQSVGEGLAQSDAAIASLATKIAQKLTAEKAQTVTVGQFSYAGGATVFNTYIGNQLTGELLDANGRSFSVVSGAGSEWIVSGEMVPMAGSMRVYARLVKREGNSVAAQFTTDVEINQSITAMLSSGGSSNPVVAFDEWEDDTWDTPVDYSSLAADAPAARTIHAGDHDWFLVTAGSEPTTMVLSTSGDMDTYMTLYDANTHEELASNDDGAGDGNSLITHFTQPGRRYMVEVRGFSEETTGNYSLNVRTEAMPEPTAYQLGDYENARPVTGRLDGRGGSAMFLLTPRRDGEMVAETTGNSDTFIELYDAETYALLDSDDDGGSNDGNAMISYEVESGVSYLVKVRGYSESTTGTYRFRAYMEEEE